MKTYAFWVIVGISFAFLPFSVAAQIGFDVPENIVENPSAENLLVDMPEKWGSYLGDNQILLRK